MILFFKTINRYHQICLLYEKKNLELYTKYDEIKQHTILA